MTDAANAVTSADLKMILDSIPAYKDGIFVGNGVEIKKGLVEIVNLPHGPSYRAKEGAQKDPRTKWLVRDIRICTGRGNCQRVCGGIGSCIVGKI